MSATVNKWRWIKPNNDCTLGNPWSQRLLPHVHCFAPPPPLFPPPQSGTLPPPPPHRPGGGRPARLSPPLPRRPCGNAPAPRGTEWVAAVPAAAVAAPGVRNTAPLPPAVPLTAGARASGADRPSARRARTRHRGASTAPGAAASPRCARPVLPAGAHVGCTRRDAPWGGTAGPPSVATAGPVRGRGATRRRLWREDAGDSTDAPDVEGGVGNDHAAAPGGEG